MHTTATQVASTTNVNSTEQKAPQAKSKCGKRVTRKPTRSEESHRKETRLSIFGSKDVPRRYAVHALSVLAVCTHAYGTARPGKCFFKNSWHFSTQATPAMVPSSMPFTIGTNSSTFAIVAARSSYNFTAAGGIFRGGLGRVVVRHVDLLEGRSHPLLRLVTNLLPCLLSRVLAGDILEESSHGLLALQEDPLGQVHLLQGLGLLLVLRRDGKRCRHFSACTIGNFLGPSRSGGICGGVACTLFGAALSLRLLRLLHQQHPRPA